MKVFQVKGLTGVLEGSKGYGDFESQEIYIEEDLDTIEEKRLLVIHEVLDMWLHGRIKHSKIDRISLGIIEGLQQIGVF